MQEGIESILLTSQLRAQATFSRPSPYIQPGGKMFEDKWFLEVEPPRDGVHALI